MTSYVPFFNSGASFLLTNPYRIPLICAARKHESSSDTYTCPWWRKILWNGFNEGEDTDILLRQASWSFLHWIHVFLTWLACTEKSILMPSAVMNVAKPLCHFQIYSMLPVVLLIMTRLNGRGISAFHKNIRGISSSVGPFYFLDPSQGHPHAVFIDIPPSEASGLVRRMVLHLSCAWSQPQPIQGLTPYHKQGTG